MGESDLKELQVRLCERFDAPFQEAAQSLKAGVAENVRSGLRPINGLRHPAEGDTTGWYIWAGQEPPADPEFFKPLHISHLDDWCPGLKKFLGLAPGWRFLTDLDGYEDVWEDPSLLDID